MFLLRGHVHATLIRTFKSVNSGRSLPSIISCVRYIHTDKDDTSPSIVKTYFCFFRIITDRDGLYEIYKGKKRKLVFNNNSHSIQKDNNVNENCDVYSSSLSFQVIHYRFMVSRTR